MENDLETLIPQPETIEIRGQQITLNPLSIGRLASVMKAIKPVLADVSLADVNLVVLASEHGEALIEAIGAATGCDQAWLSDLPADEFIFLAAKVLEINADFFARRVLPEITAAAEKIGKLGAGPTPSTP